MGITCPISEVVECTSKLAGNKMKLFWVSGISINLHMKPGLGIIAECVATGINVPGFLAQCMAEEIGAEDECYPCICDVLNYLGMGPC